MDINIIELRDQSLSLLEQLGFSNYWAVIFQSIIALFLIFFCSWIVGKIGKFILSICAPLIVKKTKTRWDDKFFEHKFFTILSYYLFGFVFFWIDSFIASDAIRAFTKNITGTYFTVVTVMLLNSVLNTFYDIYIERHPTDKVNLKIYIQLIKVIVFSFAGIVVISFFANKNFMDILTGLGAMVTILLIVYKDTILGFVAGISLSANKMLHVGDWISVPNHGADGTVIEIGLNAVKVQNWDKTITTIPPYKLTSESFTNWKGMEESGGRRIKRSINIDIDSIHFLSAEDIERFSHFKLLKDYINEKKYILSEFNGNEVNYFNQRRLTNIGTFKKYLENYLLASGVVHPEMTFMVRQLQSTEKGVPIEVYFFSKEQEWEKYEQIQSDLFDHFFAVTKEFDLRIFQNVSAASVYKAVES